MKSVKAGFTGPIISAVSSAAKSGGGQNSILATISKLANEFTLFNICTFNNLLMKTGTWQHIDEIKASFNS